MKTYTQSTCEFCGKIVSTNGLAQANHKLKHVKEGLLIRIDVPYSDQKKYGYGQYRYETTPAGWEKRKETTALLNAERERLEEEWRREKAEYQQLQMEA